MKICNFTQNVIPRLLIFRKNFILESVVKKMIYFIENPQEITWIGGEAYNIAAERFDEHKINSELAKLVLGEVE
jgi:hypothetical protein